MSQTTTSASAPPRSVREEKVVQVTPPSGRNIVTVSFGPGDVLALPFPLEDARMARLGGSLIFQVDEGTLVIKDFYNLRNPGNMPEFQLQDGSAVAGRDFEAYCAQAKLPFGNYTRHGWLGGKEADDVPDLMSGLTPFQEGLDSGELPSLSTGAVLSGVLRETIGDTLFRQEARPIGMDLPETMQARTSIIPLDARMAAMLDTMDNAEQRVFVWTNGPHGQSGQSESLHNFDFQMDGAASDHIAIDFASFFHASVDMDTVLTGLTGDAGSFRFSDGNEEFQVNFLTNGSVELSMGSVEAPDATQSVTIYANNDFTADFNAMGVDEAQEIMQILLKEYGTV